MKHNLVLLLCFVTVQCAQAQSINLFGVDATNFPTMKAKFWAFDSAGNKQSPTVSEFILSENGVVRIVTNVSCPPLVQPKALSSVLVVDVSSSMKDGSGSIPNIDLAKTAARAWVNGLPSGQSECAITSFDDVNYLNQDFTSDKSRLFSAINALQPIGGTDYDVALTKPMAGGLVVSKSGMYQKVLVLLTDGQPNYEPKVSTIVSEANRQGCMIFCVTLGMPAPKSLKDIAYLTGGEVYENVTTVQQATGVYNRILQVAQGGLPCTITWQSDIPCESSNRHVEVIWQKQKTTIEYVSQMGVVAPLLVKPTFISFGKRQPSLSYDTTISLIAPNNDFTVTDIKHVFGSSSFKVLNASFPIIIPKNSSRSITVRFTPNDSTIQVASFEVITDQCTRYFSAVGGFPTKKMLNSTLELTSPNGGEYFLVGSDTTITWKGVSPTDTVTLEFSVNNGNNWSVITNSALGLKYIWNKLPKKTSSQCLIRIKQLNNHLSLFETDSNARMTLFGHTAQVNGVAYSPDGQVIATAGSDNKTNMWNTKTGALIQTLFKHKSDVWSVAFNPNGRTIATASWDNTVNIFDTKQGTLLGTLTGHTDDVVDVAFSPNGDTIITASYDGTFKIWDADTRAFIRTVSAHIPYVTSVAYSPNGKFIATTGYDNKAKLWDAGNSQLLRNFTGHSNHVNCVAFSPDGNTMITGSDDKTAIIWDINTGTPLITLVGHTGFVTDVAFCSDARTLATSSVDGTVRLWDVSTGNLIRILSGHISRVNGVTFSPDGRKIATCGQDKTVKIWDVDVEPLQEDISDAMFSIVAPSPASTDVDLKYCIVGSYKDSVVTMFIQNKGNYPFRVDSIVITNDDASQFQVVSGSPPYIVSASGNHAVEFRFKPISVGIETAQLLVFTQTDTLRQTIRGEGISPTLQVVNNIIDFGKVMIGKQRDTLQTVTIKNIGHTNITINNTIHAGPNNKDFSTLTGGGTFTLQPREVRKVDLRFTATEVGRTSGRLLFEYNGIGSPATVQLFAEGIDNTPSITSTASVIFDTVCIGKTTTTNVVITNNGEVPLQLLRAEWVNNTGAQFTTSLTPKTLEADSSVTVNIGFTPNVVGISKADVRFIADKDTAISTFTGIGKICSSNSDTVRTTVSIQNITAEAGDRVDLKLILKKQSGMQLAGAPTDWYARVHYNSSVLYNTQTNDACIGVKDSCALELNGTYNPAQSELVSVPCIVTLGNTDNATITIDEFRWLNNSIATEVATENGAIHVTNVCNEGGVRLFIPSNTSTSLATRPNPAQNSLTIHYGLREQLTVTIELLNTTGQVVQTLRQSQQQIKGEYTLTEDISTLSNGVYVLRMITNKDILTTRVDIVK